MTTCGLALLCCKLSTLAVGLRLGVGGGIRWADGGGSMGAGGFSSARDGVVSILSFEGAVVLVIGGWGDWGGVVSIW